MPLPNLAPIRDRASAGEVSTTIEAGSKAANHGKRRWCIYRAQEIGMNTDRFGNPHAPNLPYARGNILTSTEDDFQKLQLAWSLIREKGPRKVFIFTGLEHRMPLEAEDLEFADD